MGFISHHIMPLVINSFGGGHTHANTHTHIPTICTESIIRNQAHAWFNNHVIVHHFTVSEFFYTYEHTVSK